MSQADKKRVFVCIFQHVHPCTHLPDEVSQRVSPVVDLPVGVHPGVCDADLVLLEQLLVGELVGQVVAVKMGRTGAGNHLHGASTRPHLKVKTR